MLVTRHSWIDRKLNRMFTIYDSLVKRSPKIFYKLWAFIRVLNEWHIKDLIYKCILYIKSSNFHRVVGLTPGHHLAVRMLCAITNSFSKTLKIFIFTTSNFFCVLKYKEKSVCLINHMFRLSRRINSKTLI